MSELAEYVRCPRCQVRHNHGAHVCTGTPGEFQITERDEKIIQLSSSLGGKIVELEMDLDQAEQKNSEYRKVITGLRDGLQELYAKRGEDELIANICSPLIDKSESYAD